MKTIKNLKTNQIERVKDDVGQKMVNQNIAVFVPKNMWKNKKIENSK